MFCDLPNGRLAGPHLEAWSEIEKELLWTWVSDGRNISKISHRPQICENRMALNVMPQSGVAKDTKGGACAWDRCHPRTLNERTAERTFHPSNCGIAAQFSASRFLQTHRQR